MEATSVLLALALIAVTAGGGLLTLAAWVALGGPRDGRWGFHRPSRLAGPGAYRQSWVRDERPAGAPIGVRVAGGLTIGWGLLSGFAIAPALLSVAADASGGLPRVLLAGMASAHLGLAVLLCNAGAALLHGEPGPRVAASISGWLQVGVAAAAFSVAHLEVRLAVPAAFALVAALLGWLPTIALAQADGGRDGGAPAGSPPPPGGPAS